MWSLNDLQFLQKTCGGVPQYSEVGKIILSMGIVRQTQLSKKLGQAHKDQAFRLQTPDKGSPLRLLSMKKGLQTF